MNMKRPDLSLLSLCLLMLLTFTGCDIVLGIFEAGLWVGIILVILVVALVVWLIRKFLS